jgi:hypothetical protein
VPGSSSSNHRNLPARGREPADRTGRVKRFRLEASFDLTGYHGDARMIRQCRKTCGMFVADNGSNC